MSVWDDADRLREAVETSTSRRMAIIRLGLSVGQSVYRRLEHHCARHGIPLDFPDPYGSQRKYSDEDVFVENSPFVNNNIDVKKRYLAMGFENVCSVCCQPPEWEGKPLTLQLDHINGVHNDHRLENLRILCPNCHTQTETYAGKCRPGEKRLRRTA